VFCSLSDFVFATIAAGSSRTHVCEPLKCRLRSTDPSLQCARWIDRLLLSATPERPLVEGLMGASFWQAGGRLLTEPVGVDPSHPQEVG
jgi:hypothetical protein